MFIVGLSGFYAVVGRFFLKDLDYEPFACGHAALRSRIRVFKVQGFIATG